MKRKMLFLLVAALSVLLVACLAFVACDKAESGYKVTLQFDSEQGSVTLSAPAEGELYDAGESVTVTVKPKLGYEPDEFTVSGHDGATLNGGGYTFDIQADTAITVTFKPSAHAVEIDVAPTAGGTATLSPQKEFYAIGETVTLNTEPSTGYVLDEIVINGSVVEDATTSYSFEVAGDTNIAVTFKAVLIGLSVKKSVGGTLETTQTEEGNRVGHENSVYYLYDYGTAVTVTVVPEPGYELNTINGTGSVASTPTLTGNSFTFTLTEESTLEATFRKVQYAISTSTDQAGTLSLSPEKETYEYGDEVTVTITPDPGYELDELTFEPELSPALTDDHFTFTVTGNLDIFATFKKIQYTIDIEIAPEDAGTITLSPQKDAYELNDAVMITVESAEGYELDSLTLAGNSIKDELYDGKYSFDVAGNTTITAQFKKLQYHVSLTVGDHGTAKLEPQQDSYEYDDVITLTATPDANYMVNLMTFNGKGFELDENNKFAFHIQGDLEANVSFIEEAVASGILTSLKGSVIFDGQCDYIQYFGSGSSVSTPTDLTTTYDTARKATLFEGYSKRFNGDNRSEVTAFWLYQDNGNGGAEMLNRDTNGKLIRTDDDYGALFEEYSNPFETLKASQLAKLPTGEWTFKSIETAEEVLAGLFQLPTYLESVTMTEDSGVITHIDFIGQHQTYSWGDDSEDFRYNFHIDVKDHGTASLDEALFKDYELTPEHEQLKAKLEALRKDAIEKGYTCVANTSLYNGTYTSYCTTDGIIAMNPYENYAYFVRPDGKLWEYHDDKQGEKGFTRILSYDELSDILAFFTLSDNKGDHYILLDSLGDGKFTVYPQIAYESDNSVPAFFAQQMATGDYQIDLFGGATSFEITLLNDSYKVLKVEFYVENYLFTLEFYMGLNEFPSEAKSVIDEATINGSIDPSYCGTWVTENGETTLDITLDRILLNDDQAEFEALTDGGYTLSCNDKTYTIKTEGDGITLTAEGEEPLTLVHCAWSMFIGKFAGYDSDDYRIDFLITASGISITTYGDTDDETLTMQATDITFTSKTFYDPDYNEYYDAYEFAFKIGADEYILQQYEPYNYDILTYAKAGDEIGTGVYRDQYQTYDSWDEYVGTYSGDSGYTVKIESDKLLVNSTEVTELELYSNYDYEYETTVYRFWFKWNGKECEIEIYDDHTIALIINTALGKYDVYYLLDEEYTYDASPYYGTYVSYLYDDEYNVTGTNCVVEVNEDGIMITIGEDGEAVEATILTFSEDYYGAVILVRTSTGELMQLQLWPSYYLGTLYLEDGSSYSLYYVTEDAE